MINSVGFGRRLLRKCSSLISASFRPFALAILILAPGLADAKIIYVNAAKPVGGDGTNWAKAFTYLRDALDVSLSGDLIFVAKGTYYPDDGTTGYYGDRELSFEVDGVNIYGGFAGTEDTIDQRDVKANETILSGEIWEVTTDPTTADYQRYWSLHVVVLKSSATFDGLTIHRGRANGDEAPYNQGGGVFVSSGTLTLNNCSINECLAAQDGGAVFGDVVATGCTFSGNRADNEFLLTDAKLKDPANTQHAWIYSPVCNGGAISGNVTATDCKFLDNHTRAHSLSLIGRTSTANGGAISGPVIVAKDCVFDGNTADASAFHIGGDADATARGGAIAGDATLVNCVFMNNQADTRAQARLMPIPPGPPYTAYPHSYGGAVSGQIGATNCVFADNSISSEFLGGNINAAISYGSAAFVEDVSDIMNCVFVRNAAMGDAGGGGAIRADGTSVLPVGNCTFLDNITDLNGTCVSVGGNVKILSNIFWSSTTPTTPEVLIWVDGISNENARARISNRLYPTPSTETINIVKGGLTGVDVNASNADFGDPPTRTLMNIDPGFVDIALPEGADGIWKTADDGIRLKSTSPAIAIGHPLFLPIDIFDLDEDGNITETSPTDVANFARIQNDTLDLGAYEFGDDLLGPEIQVEQPAGVVLNDGVGVVNFGASPGVPAVKTFVIKNTGLLALKGLSITKSGPNSSDFAVSQPLKTTLGASSTTTFRVTLNPTSPGLKTATLQISSNDTDEDPFDISIQGETLLPDIAVEHPTGTSLVDGSSTINYGTVAALGSSTKVFKISNTGQAKLTIAAISSTGSSAKEFKASGPAISNLLPGDSTTFRVVFSPTSAGARSAVINITSNDPDAESLFSINVTGNGTVAPEIAVSQPSSVNLVDGVTKSYGEVKKGLSYSKTFTIKNVGSDKLKNLALSLSGSGAFSKSNLSVSSLEPGEKTTFSVTFKPTSTGKKSATLRIASNDADENPFDIILTGTGVAGNSSAAPSGFAAVAKSAAVKGDAAETAGNSAVVTTIKAADGLEYQVLTVAKTPGWSASNHTAEVSSNLVDWFSGNQHTTTLRDDADVLRVRDNTPVGKGEKRYIRLK